MLLATDVGNTQTHLGVFSRDELVHQWRASTDSRSTADELALQFGEFLSLADLSFSNQITGVCISSVVPRVTQELREMTIKYFGFPPVVVEAGTKTGEYIVQISGPCNLPAFHQLPQFLPLNCQLINPVKLSAAVDTVTVFGLDLARVDHVFAITIFGGFALSGLAIIAAILQFVQVKMTSPRPNPEDPTSSMTSTMTYTFPLLTIFWGGIFPSGLILYWITYTGYLVLQQYLIMGWGNLFPLFGWQPSWAVSPETGITPATRPKRSDATDVPANPDPNPRAPASGGSRNNPRPANRRPGSAKRRGKKR